jgi:hypothetical protein
VSVPAGATILDIIVNGVALWNNAGACTLKVGDVADDDGYFTAVDLKATDLLAGESLSFALPAARPAPTSPTRRSAPATPPPRGRSAGSSRPPRRAARRAARA